ncbi:MAG: hypothetical protein KKD05_09420 [Candidatus Omnitrophica bacterium]|nr:hypothetical protein [Candidatus Omnitrophota bacterium]
MRNFKIFLILIICVIAVQLSMDGLSFASDQAEAAERYCQLRECENYKAVGPCARVQKIELSSRLMVIACFVYRRLPVFVFATNKKCSIFVSELFNNSPPFLYSLPEFS